MIPSTHRQIRLAARPVGFPAASDFRLVEAPCRSPAPHREDAVDGIERSPGALIGLLHGRNLGKMLVRVGAEPGAE